MASPPAPSSHPGRKGNPVSLGNLTPEQAISGIFRIKSADVERIRAEEKKMKAKPKKGRK